jgi:hypothetical protein
VKYLGLKWVLQALGLRFVVLAVLKIMLGKTTLKSREDQ